MSKYVIFSLAALAVALTVVTGGPAESEVTFRKYMTYDEVARYLRALQQKYPKLVTVGSAGKSVEGRDLLYARVSTGGHNNKVMLVDALTHAREWITLPTVLYFLKEIVESKRDLINGLDVVVLPILNPDGYEYSRTKDRLWRKNRGATFNKTCPGVDLNRNFDYHWADFKTNGGASGDPCYEDYAGPNAASEPETRNYQKFILGLKGVTMYVNFHAPEQSIYIPWGYSTSAPALPDASKLTAIAKEANAALTKAGAPSHKVEGMAADYPATGTSLDWVRAVAGVRQSFCVEMIPGYDGTDMQRFVVPENRILPTSKQMFEAIKVFVKYAKTPLSQ